MKAKEQLLDFVNLTLGVLLIGFFVYYFTIPGNFERFQDLLISFTPLAFFAATLIIRMKLTSDKIKEEGAYADEGAFLRLTYWDKIKLEIVLIGLPIAMIIAAIAFNRQSWYAAGESVAVFIVNTLVLRSIFKKN
jgi:hypothetical protein